MDTFVRLQMLWDNPSCIGTKALAPLGLEFRRLSSDVAIVAVDGAAFDPFAFQQDGLAPAKVNVGRR